MTWTIKSLLDWTTEYFTKHGIEHPHLEAEIILANVLKFPRINLYVQFEKVLDEDILSEFKKLIIRRAKREPLAYITGAQPFMGLEFIITPEVLIPRPETEKLVEVVIDLIKFKIQNAKVKNKVEIIDIGTGCGAIAVSLAKFLDKVCVYGTDKSEKAIEIAKQNAQKFGVGDKCKFVVGDLFTDLNIKADIIVSNPPYIPTAEIDKLQPEIKNFEPRAALDGGEDGLDYYRRINSEVLKYLKDDGALVLEIGANQADAAKKIFSNNFINIKIFKDYSGVERIILAKFS